MKTRKGHKYMIMKWPCLQRLSDHFGAPSLLRILYLSAHILRRISCLLAKEGMNLPKEPQEFSITSLSCAKLTAPHVATHKLERESWREGELKIRILIFSFTHHQACKKRKN